MPWVLKLWVDCFAKVGREVYHLLSLCHELGHRRPGFSVFVATVSQPPMNTVPYSFCTNCLLQRPLKLATAPPQCHICCLSTAPWHKSLSSSCHWKAKAHKHTGTLMNNLPTNSKISQGWNFFFSQIGHLGSFRCDRGWKSCDPGWKSLLNVPRGKKLQKRFISPATLWLLPRYNIPATLAEVLFKRMVALPFSATRAIPSLLIVSGWPPPVASQPLQLCSMALDYASARL